MSLHLAVQIQSETKTSVIIYTIEDRNQRGNLESAKGFKIELNKH